MFKELLISAMKGILDIIGSIIGSMLFMSVLFGLPALAIYGLVHLVEVFIPIQVAQEKPRSDPCMGELEPQICNTLGERCINAVERYRLLLKIEELEKPLTKEEQEKQSKRTADYFMACLDPDKMDPQHPYILYEIPRLMEMKKNRAVRKP
jgi:hypothetical protein